MREIQGGNANKVAAETLAYAEHNVDSRAIKLDMQDQASVDSAIQIIINAAGQRDVSVHNAGQRVPGPAESFTPELFAKQYDANVLGTQRVTVLRGLPAKRSGRRIWISSTSVRGDATPYFAPYFAGKAAMATLVQTIPRPE